MSFCVGYNQVLHKPSPSQLEQPQNSLNIVIINNMKVPDTVKDTVMRFIILEISVTVMAK
jgi:hypothetical protein